MFLHEFLVLFLLGKQYTQRSHFALFWGSLATLGERYSKLVLLTVIDWLPLFILLRRTLTVLSELCLYRFSECFVMCLCNIICTCFSYLLQNIVIRKKIEEIFHNLFVESRFYIYYLFFPWEHFPLLTNFLRCFPFSSNWLWDYYIKLGG